MARTEGSTSTLDVVARAEGQERLLRAVLALEEPFRSAILLRFYEDLSPSALAERTGVPVETARSRVRRGVERLRGALDTGPGGRNAWVAAFLAFDSTGSATGSPPAAPSPGAPIAPWAGAGVVVVAIAVAVIVGLGRSDPPTPDGLKAVSYTHLTLPTILRV